MRRLLIPEAIQTSAMDCGPASLKALLEGFGIPVSYGRLREACQTDVDGTSIDQVEEAAVQLGLDAVQVMIPADHLLVPEAGALPAIAVVRQPGGETHFAVLWRRHGSLVQVMDPAVGRRWTSAARLLAELYIHEQSVPAATWREWAGTGAFLKPLASRLRRLGAQPAPAITSALRDESATSLARLDAATRMTEALAANGAVARGAECARLVERLAGGDAPIPPQYWSADPREPDSVRLRGAVLIHAEGRRKIEAAPISPELAAALNERAANPRAELWRAVREDGLLHPSLLVGALALAAAGTVVEAMLFRGFFDLGRELATAAQRMAAISLLLAFSGALLLLDFLLAGSVLRAGRRLEGRLRVRFLAKIPRLHDRYFQSRPISDMAERCHNIHQLRQGPELAAGFLRSVFGIAFTVAAVAWLYSGALRPAAGVAAVSLAIPLLARPALAERDLRLRSHSGALTRYYLDALLGLTAIRAHGAEHAVRGAQLNLLDKWARAGFSLQRTVVMVEGLQYAAGLGTAAWLVWDRLGHAGEIGGMLLLVYWVLNLPAMGQEAAMAIRQYPAQRNTALRLLEPLGAPEEELVDAAESQTADSAAAIRLEGVTVRSAGNAILDNVTLDVPAGSHIAIVGASGAGKSSLVGLLLGWHRPASGRVLVDGEPLDAARLERLRRDTAWVDPQVRLWNSSLYDNLRYGSEETPAAMEPILERANLAGVAGRLPDGMQTALGEGGALVSGGEGQRVRVGRAMCRPGVRLAILDEPARGLDRVSRQAALERAREHWRNATLLCITHDVADTRDFERVVVMDSGAVAEDGSPRELAARPESRYRRLLDAEEAVRRGLWASTHWRRLRLQNGKLTEQPRGVFAGGAGRAVS